MQQLEFKIGLDAIASYRRLNYTAWHALAEFVDNSTQAYFNNQTLLDEAFSKEGRELEVHIVYERGGGTLQQEGLLRIADNSIGMTYEELEHALHVARPPVDTSGRSKYGMGMKTASCWIGNKWSIRTKKLGETVEHSAVVDVNAIAGGNGAVQYMRKGAISPDDHYTVIEIRQHNQKWQGRTIGKIQDYLRSMYREDFRRGILTLTWQGHALSWEDPEFLKAQDGSPYQQHYQFRVDERDVKGWIGILASGGRANAGFSIIHSGRVVKGWPDSWRPGKLYGQVGGSNDLVNQRLVGEIHLDGFEVSHTKDDILWIGDEEEQVEEELARIGANYRKVALDTKYRGGNNEGGPTKQETKVALSSIQEELESPEMIDAIKLETVAPPGVAKETISKLAVGITTKKAADLYISPSVLGLEVAVYLVDELSPSDPYFFVDAPSKDYIQVIINQEHPHWRFLDGSVGVLNFIRHCVYDAIAEWKASQMVGIIDPTTVKLFKDKFLRVPFEMEMHEVDKEVREQLQVVPDKRVDMSADTDS